VTVLSKKDATSLAHYDQVSLYETAFKARKEDVSFFTRLARDLLASDRLAAEVDGSVLEYGAGAGRVTLPLARAGHRVTAVDASQPMLERLEERLSRAPRKVRERVECIKGDMRRYQTKERYPLVLATFNVVGHMSTFKDMARFLGRAKSHLKRGGTLAFDVPLPHPEELEADRDELFPAPRFKHPDTGEWIRQTERFEYDPHKQLLLVESRFRTEGSEDTLTVPLILRQWFPKELEAALRFAGFRTVETFADYSQSPGLLAQDSLVFVARA
jgi:SAM-dependent methyltransferase